MPRQESCGSVVVISYYPHRHHWDHVGHLSDCHWNYRGIINTVFTIVARLLWLDTDTTSVPRHIHRTAYSHPSGRKIGLSCHASDREMSPCRRFGIIRRPPYMLNGSIHMVARHKKDNSVPICTTAACTTLKKSMLIACAFCCPLVCADGGLRRPQALAALHDTRPSAADRSGPSGIGCWRTERMRCSGAAVDARGRATHPQLELWGPSSPGLN